MKKKSEGTVRAEVSLRLNAKVLPHPSPAKQPPRCYPNQLPGQQPVNAAAHSKNNEQ